MRFPKATVSRTVALWMLFQSLHAYAGGIAHVEKHGDDSHPCTQSLPCLTIQHAIDTVQTRGRVLVGPGVYAEKLVINYDGLRLISKHGRTATHIDLTDTPITIIGGQIIEINADKVIIGQKRRGFSLRHRLSESGIVGYGNGIRIEDNIITTLDGRYGIALFGNNLTVRDNIVSKLLGGDGIFLSRAVAGESGGRNWLVQGNRVTLTGTGFEFYSTSANNRLRNYDNTVDGPAGDGFFVDNYIVDNGVEVPNPDKSGDKHRNLNVTSLRADGGTGFWATGGNPSVSRVNIYGTSPDEVGFSLSHTNRADVRELTVTVKLGQTFSSAGIWISNSQRPFIYHSSVRGYLYSLRLVNVEGAGFVRNDITGAESCALDVQSDLPGGRLSFFLNFWGNPSGPDLSCDPEAAALLESGLLTLNPKSETND